MKPLGEPKLYLDIDGVIITDYSPFEQEPLNNIENYAPEVARRLGSTGLELVWLSSWDNGSMSCTERVEAFRKGRSLEPATNSHGHINISQKLRALIVDQIKDPSPFVWVDDEITLAAKREIDASLKVPSLLIAPERSIGLNERELWQIEDFARIHNSKLS